MSATKRQAKAPPEDSIEIEKDIHPNWVALIKLCGAVFQNGKLVFGTQGGVPMSLIDMDEQPIFGKDSQKPLFVKDINAELVRVRLTRKWAGLIDFCMNSFPYGQVGTYISAAEPTRPIPIHKITHANIRFDHPESFPDVVRFYPVRKGIE